MVTIFKGAAQAWYLKRLVDKKVMQSNNAPSHFILADHEHHQAQRLSAATQERLCERRKVSPSKQSQQSTTINSSSGKTFQNSEKVRSQGHLEGTVRCVSSVYVYAAGAVCWHKVSSE